MAGECFNTNISDCHLINADSYPLGWGTATGGLVGYAEESTFSHCSTTARRIGGNDAGGLVGKIKKTRLIQCSSSAPVDGDDKGQNGGLVGTATDDSFLYQCSASGYVGWMYVLGSHGVDGGLWGGLVGRLENSTIEECYASGNVELNGTSWNGETDESTDGIAAGLVGGAYGNFLIKNSYSTGYTSTEGGDKWDCTQTAAGLVGIIRETGGKIENCYASGRVRSSGNPFSYILGKNTTPEGLGRGGGLVGDIYAATNIKISNCFATGEATNNWYNKDQEGGFLGNQYNSTPTYSNNYWYNTTNKFGVGLKNGKGPLDQEGTKKTDIAGITKATGVSNFYGTGSDLGKAVYSTWDFDKVWKSRSGKYPCLRWDQNCK